MSTAELLEKIDEIELSVIQMGDNEAFRRNIDRLRDIVKYLESLESLDASAV